MLIAYNNDIEFRSKMYHIQTEDNGIKDGHITTTVFHSGRTLDSKTISYKEAIEGITDPEEQNKIIKSMMIEQHKKFYAKLYDGQYEPNVQGDSKSSSENSATSRNPSNSQMMGNSGLNPELSQSGSVKVNKPDILRASQSVANVARPVGLKSFSALSPSGLSRPTQSGAINSIAPIHAPSTATASVQRHPGVKPRLSKAVEKANYERKKRAYAGFRWTDEDLAIDALVAQLLDNG